MANQQAMRSKRLPSLIIGAFIALALLGIALFWASPPEAVRTGTEAGSASAAELQQLEQELTVAQERGGISPERNAAITSRLDALAAQGAPADRLASVRALLAALTVGSSRSPAPEPSPPPVPLSAPPQPAEDLAALAATLERQIAQAAAPGGGVREDAYLSMLRTLDRLAAGGYDPEQVRQLNATFQEKVINPNPSCVSDADPVFTEQFIDPEKLTGILPPPNRPKSDLTVLKTHSFVTTASSGVSIYAPADMELINGANYVGGPYALDFRVTCEVMIRYGHVEPIPAIKDRLPAEPQEGSAMQQIWPVLKFKAGDLVAYTGGPPHTFSSGVDFGLYNSVKPNRFASDPTYNTSTIYSTAVCPYEYFTTDLEAAYRTKFYLAVHDGMSPDSPSFCA